MTSKRPALLIPFLTLAACGDDGGTKGAADARVSDAASLAVDATAGSPDAAQAMAPCQWTSAGFIAGSGSTLSGVAARAGNAIDVLFTDADGALRLASSTGRAFAVTTPVTGGTGSIAVDPGGKLAISYDHAEGLHFASNATGSWVDEPVDLTENVDANRLAIDAAGKPHIVYYAFSRPRSLRYATRGTDGKLTHQDIDAPPEQIDDPALALDAEGRPHVAYMRGGELVYARQEGGGWNREIVDLYAGTGTNFSPGVSLAIDATGAPVIAYHAWSVAPTGGPQQGRVRVARRAVAGWRLVTVDESNDTTMLGENPSLVLDAQKRVRLTYETGTFAVNHAWGPPEGPFSSELIQSHGCCDLALTIDPGGRLVQATPRSELGLDGIYVITCN